MKKITLALILFFIGAGPGFCASKESLVKKGNALYQKNNFAESVKEYETALKKDPESPAINFDLGTALYKNKKYAEAISYLQKGLLSKDPLLKKQAHFNLGDAFYKKGRELEGSRLDEAIADLEESLRQFEAVRNVDDKDNDAKYNHDTVKKELERLKEKKEQRRKKGGDQSENEPEQKKNQGSKEDTSTSSPEKNQPDQKKDQGSKEDTSQPSLQKSHTDKNLSYETAQHSEEKKEENKAEQGFSQSKDKKTALEKDSPLQAVQIKPGQMSKEEAKALLEHFEQGEEAPALLNFGKRKSSEESVVSKDW